MGPHPGHVVVRARRLWLAAAETFVSVGAFAGAAGLAVGSIDFGATITARLPFGSPVLAGVALATVVGVSMAIGAWQAWRGNERADVTALAAGLLLVGWIVVEVSVIRAFSWLQPTLLACGVAIAAAGYRGVKPRRDLSA
jgi:hypothetical protein